VPADLVGLDGKTESIKIGKAADLVLVDGDPSTRFGNLRQTHVVMLDSLKGRWRRHCRAGVNCQLLQTDLRSVDLL
jgi:hypothetical protein